MTTSEVDLFKERSSKVGSVTTAMACPLVGGALAFDGMPEGSWFAIAINAIPGLTGVWAAVSLVRGLPRLLVGQGGGRLEGILRITVRRWAELGLFAPDGDGVVSNLYRREGGAAVFKIDRPRDQIGLAEALNRWRDRFGVAR